MANPKKMKMQYIEELEQKVQTLHREANLLSTKLMLVQRRGVRLENQNNALKVYRQAMEQQLRAQNAHNETLFEEVQKLKQLVNETTTTNLTYQKLNLEMQQNPEENQNRIMATKPESND